MLNHNSILNKQTNLLATLATKFLMFLTIAVFSSCTGLLSTDTSAIEFNVPEVINPELDDTAGITDEIGATLDEINIHILKEYQPGMSQQAIEGKLLCHIGIIRHKLNEAAETLDEHADKLMDNDPETRQLYHNIAAAIYAVKNSDKITDKEQALLTAQIINAIDSGASKLLTQKSEVNLSTVETNLKTYVANLHRDISTAKKRGASAKEIKKLQAELKAIKQAATSLAKLNKPLELLDWVKTAQYDPRAMLARWYLGISLAKKSSAS